MFNKIFTISILSFKIYDFDFIFNSLMILKRAQYRSRENIVFYINFILIYIKRYLMSNKTFTITDIIL